MWTHGKLSSFALQYRMECTAHGNEYNYVESGLFYMYAQYNPTNQPVSDICHEYYFCFHYKQVHEHTSIKTKSENLIRVDWYFYW